MTKSIRYHCPHCEKRLSIAELLERFCETCQVDITPTEAPKAKSYGRPAISEQSRPRGNERAA